MEGGGGGGDLTQERHGLKRRPWRVAKKIQSHHIIFFSLWLEVGFKGTGELFFLSFFFSMFFFFFNLKSH